MKDAMNTRILIKCDTSVYADEIVAALEANHIASMQHDENQDYVVGAYGAKTGISIFVYEKDWERAKQVIAPIGEARKASVPWCPKCGSEDVEQSAVRRSHATLALTVNVFLFLLPFFYFYYAGQAKLVQRSALLDNVAWGMLIAGVAMWVFHFVKGNLPNCRCRQCGHKFRHLPSR